MPLYLDIGPVWFLASNQLNMTNTVGCHFCDRLDKIVTFSFPSQTLPLVALIKQILCWAMQGNEGRLQPTAIWTLRPSAQHPLRKSVLPTSMRA